MPPEGRVKSLEYLMLRRICRDIVYHSLQYEAASDKTLYVEIQRRYADQMLDIIREMGHQPGTLYGPLEILHQLYAEGKRLEFLSCLNFLFNEFLERVHLHSKDCNEGIIVTLSHCCKNLRSLTISNVSLIRELFVPCFKHLGQLTSLTLRSCFLPTLEILEVIANFLPHLQTLDMSETSINDRGLYLLCGHKLPDMYLSSLNCCYTKMCGVNTVLRLQYMFIDGHGVHDDAIACLLTHIPTLKHIRPYFFNTHYKLSRVVCNISTARAVLGIPNSTLELVALNVETDQVENWQTFLQSCLKLKILDANIPGTPLNEGQNLGAALAQSKLRQLTELWLHFKNSSEIFAEYFQYFWMVKGHQLRLLYLHRDFAESHFNLHPNHLRQVLTCCPNLELLSVFKANLVEGVNAEDFSALPFLERLTLCFNGAVEPVCTLISKILYSAVNIASVNLEAPGRTEFFLGILTRQAFSNLKEVRISGFNWSFHL